MKDDQATVDETFKSVINTYSRATLNNTRRIVIQNEPEAVAILFTPPDISLPMTTPP